MLNAHNCCIWRTASCKTNPKTAVTLRSRVMSDATFSIFVKDYCDTVVDTLRLDSSISSSSCITNDSFFILLAYLAIINTAKSVRTRPFFNPWVSTTSVQGETCLCSNKHMCCFSHATVRFCNINWKQNSKLSVYLINRHLWCCLVYCNTTNTLHTRYRVLYCL